MNGSASLGKSGRHTGVPEAHAQSDLQAALLDLILQHVRQKALPACEDEKERETELFQGVAKACGAFGSDGWHGDEIAVLHARR